DVGKEVTFKITNKAGKTLGVDIKLNGTSLYKEQTDDPAQCQVFLLDNDKHSSYALKGYFIQENDSDPVKMAPFKILVGEDAQKWRESAGQLGEKVGTIAITVFEEGDQSGNEILVSARGVKKAQEKSARVSLPTLQRALM